MDNLINFIGNDIYGNPLYSMISNINLKIKHQNAKNKDVKKGYHALLLGRAKLINPDNPSIDNLI